MSFQPLPVSNKISPRVMFQIYSRGCSGGSKSEIYNEIWDWVGTVSDPKLWEELTGIDRGITEKISENRYVVTARIKLSRYLEIIEHDFIVNLDPAEKILPVDNSVKCPAVEKP